MADTTGSGFLGDATGGIGQGLAFVLPESKSATYAMQLAQTHASQLQGLAKAKVAAMQKAQQQYEDDFKSQELPKAFGPIDKELNDRHNKWLQDAAKSYATTGKNPFNDPDFVARHNTEVMVPAGKSKEFGELITKRIAAMQADKDGKYSDASKKQFDDWYNGFLKSDNKLDYIDKPIPELKDREMSADDLHKELKPTASGDASFNNAQVFAAVTGDPKWRPLLQKYGYNPDLPDFGVYTDPSHPNGKRVWYTNPVATGHQADLILEAPGDPKNAKILADLGIHPDDQYAKEKLQHAIADQNAAMGTLVKENGQRLNDPEKMQQLIDQKNQQQRDKEKLNIEYAHLSIDQKKLQMEQNKQHADNIVQKVYEDTFGSLTGLQAISKAYETNPSFRSRLQNLHDDGKTVTFTIPPKKKLNPNWTPSMGNKHKDIPEYIETTPSIPVRLDRSDPTSFKAGIYEALKNVGSPTQMSKFTSGKGNTPVKNKTKGYPGVDPNLDLTQ